MNENVGGRIMQRDARRAVEEREGMKCGECGQWVKPAAAFHPFLYCLLYKNGIREQAKYSETHRNREKRNERRDLLDSGDP